MSVSAVKLRGWYNKYPHVPDSVEFLFGKRNPRKILGNCIIGHPEKLIDICGGSGASCIPLAERFSDMQISCVDRSYGMLNILKKRIAKKNISNISVHEMDASNLNFDSESFDAATIALVFHELEESDIQKILNETKRVLKKDGVLYLTEWDPPEKWFGKLVFKFLEVSEPPTFHNFIYQDLKVYMEEHGFTVLNEVKCDFTRIIACRKGAPNDN